MAGPPLPRLELPQLVDGVDLGSLYELAALLVEPGSRCAALQRGGVVTRAVLDVDALLDDPATRVIVCCGSGGVGKTTTSAALALRAAERGRTAVVLTIDPARRLAQALGLEALEQRAAAGCVDAEGPGELHAMMLDMRRTFDEMVQAHAAPDRAATILANPFYQTISTSFSGTQEYMAMEKLGQLAATGEWDLIVVDTPPSRSALDFLDAPQRMSNFLDGRMIRLLSAPARAGGRGLRKIVGAGFSLFAKAVSTILGGQLLADASAFVQAFDTMFGGFRERATATYALLRSPGTAFVVVAAPEPDALREAAYFVDRLSAERDAAGRAGAQPHPPGAGPAVGDPGPRRGRRPARRPAGRRGAAAARRPGRSRRPRGAAALPVHQRAPRRAGGPGAGGGRRRRRPGRAARDRRECAAASDTASTSTAGAAHRRP